MPIRIDPDLEEALVRSPGPCRVSVRAAVRQPVLEAAVRSAAAAVEAATGIAAIPWRYVETWVGELVIDLRAGSSGAIQANSRAGVSAADAQAAPPFGELAKGVGRGQPVKVTATVASGEPASDGDGVSPAQAATVVQAIVDGLGHAGVRDADLLAVGVAAQPHRPGPAPQGQGRSRVLNGLAEAVGSAMDRAKDPVGARRAREAAAGAMEGNDAVEDQRRRAVLGLVLRQWLPDELDAAGASAEAAALRALPDPATDATAVLDAVGRAVLAAVDRLAATPRAAVLDLESAYAAGRDLHDVTWGCAGEQGRAGEALVEAAAKRRPDQPGQVLWSLASTGAFQRLLPLVEALGPDALERWRRITHEERTLHALVVKVMGAPTATDRLTAIDQALRGAVTQADPAAAAALEAALARLPSVAWSLALCTAWEAAGERCRHIVARQGAKDRTALTARDAATEAVLTHIQTLTASGATLLHHLTHPSPSSTEP